MAPWRLFTSVRAWCVACAVTLATWRLCTGACTWCVLFVVSVATWRSFTDVGSCDAACVVSLAPWLSFVRGLCVVWGAAFYCAFMCPVWFLRAPRVLAALRDFGVVCVPRDGHGFLAPGAVPWLWPRA